MIYLIEIIFVKVIVINIKNKQLFKNQLNPFWQIQKLYVQSWNDFDERDNLSISHDSSIWVKGFSGKYITQKNV